MPLEEDRRTVVGLERAAEVRRQHTVGTPAREVRGAEARREAAPFGAALGEQEALALSAQVDAPALRCRERAAVERLQPHQAAAIPATVAGTPSHDPTAASEPPSPTD